MRSNHEIAFGGSRNSPWTGFRGVGQSQVRDKYRTAEADGLPSAGIECLRVCSTSRP
jgi:hypothetical protein